MTRKVIFRSNDREVHFVLDEHVKLDFYSARLLGRHVTTLRHITLILSKPVYM